LSRARGTFRDRRGAYRCLVERHEGRDHLENRYKWENNIKMDHEEMGWRGIHCIAVAQERDRQQAVVNAAMNIRVS
jgi:hypothetical protein